MKLELSSSARPAMNLTVLGSSVAVVKGVCPLHEQCAFAMSLPVSGCLKCCPQPKICRRTGPALIRSRLCLLSGGDRLVLTDSYVKGVGALKCMRV